MLGGRERPRALIPIIGHKLSRLGNSTSFRRWITSSARSKSDCGIVRPSAVAVLRLMVSSIGFQQVSELIHLSGIDILGPLPPDIQHITIFSSGIHTGATKPDAAKALAKFLTSPSAAMVIKKNGMEPG